VNGHRTTLKDGIVFNRQGAMEAAEPGFIEEKVTV